MDNVYIVIGIAIIVIGILVICKKYSLENFDNKFIESASSEQFIQYLDMGDHRTVVNLQRGDNGDTVLLLHNMSLTSEIWHPLFQTLQRYSMSDIKTPNLVSYDLRGFGTAWMPVPQKFLDKNIYNSFWSLEQYVADCVNVYNKIIGSGKIILVGFGLGGLVAQKFALANPTLIKKLVILQTSILLDPELVKGLGILSEWAAKKPDITYLTMQEDFVQKILCEWFYTPLCEQLDDSHHNDQNTPQYNLITKLYREASVSSSIQGQKLLLATNLELDWEMSGKLEFPVHILAATDDPIASPNRIVQTFTTIQNKNRALQIILDIVSGRRGFSVLRPDYIAGIICTDCEKMGADDTTKTKLLSSTYGF